MPDRSFAHALSRLRPDRTGGLVPAATLLGLALLVSQLADPDPPARGGRSLLPVLLAAAGVGWLIVGHHRAARSAARLKGRLDRQIELNRELTATLESGPVADALRIADLKAAARPQFVQSALSELPGVSNAVRAGARRFYYQFCNQGDWVSIVAAESRTVGLIASLPGFDSTCPKGSEFRVDVTAARSLDAVGPIALVVHFRNKFDQTGRAEITAPRFADPPRVVVHMNEESGPVI